MTDSPPFTVTDVKQPDALLDPSELPTLTLISHSTIVYWWPVWLTGYIIAVLSYLQGREVYIQGGDLDMIHPSASLGVIYVAVLLLVEHYRRGDAAAKARVYDHYLANRRYVNNWDIVDSSAHLIVGPQLQDGDRKVLVELAASDVLWDRRIAMMATLHYIRQRDFVDALQLAQLLLDDDEDLIHKAVGWMLREIGKRNIETEEKFLKKYYRQMPRTMLRYAIEKFPEPKRLRYLKGNM